MKTPATRKRLVCTALLLLAAAQTAHAQSIYKCTKAGQVEYTDHPCTSGKGELIHHLEALYKDLLEARQQKMEARALQQADEAKQRDEAARQQALVNEAAYRGWLQGQNDALRQQQNDQYLDQDQPVYGYAPVYWGAVPPYWNHGHDHGHGTHPPPPRPVPHAPPAGARGKY